MRSKDKVKESLAGLLTIIEGYVFYLTVEALNINFNNSWLPITVLYLLVFFGCNHVISQGVDLFDNNNNNSNEEN